MNIEAEFRKAAESLRTRWPQAGWAVDVDETGPKKYCTITGTFGDVRVYMESRCRASGVTWDAQVEGAERDWNIPMENPVSAMEVAIDCVGSVGKIWEKLSTGLAKSGDRKIKKGRKIVGRTDKVYHIRSDDTLVVFAEVEVLGEMTGILKYNGRRIKATFIDGVVGLEVGPDGPRGPLFKGMRFEVLE